MNFLYINNPPSGNLLPIIPWSQGKGLLGSQGPAWQEARRFVQQDMMRPRSALFYIDTVDTSSRQLGDLLGRSRGPGDAVVGDLLPHVYRLVLQKVPSEGS